MTANADLERTARAVIPPVNATGWRISAEAVGYAVVPIIGGRLDGRPVFRGSQRDATRMHRLLTGEAPASRSAAAEPAPPLDGPDRQPDQLLTATPVPPAGVAPAHSVAGPTGPAEGAGSAQVALFE